MTLSDLISPERVREIAEDVDGNYYDMGWSVSDIGEKAIELAAPEIAAAALEMAAKRCDDKVQREYLEYGRVAMELAEELRQMAKGITDAK